MVDFRDVFMTNDGLTKILHDYLRKTSQKMRLFTCVLFENIYERKETFKNTSLILVNLATPYDSLGTGNLGDRFFLSPIFVALWPVLLLHKKRSN